MKNPIFSFAVSKIIPTFEQKLLCTTPEVFNLFGYSFYFYSKEHEPIHIHVEGEEGLVIYDLIDGEFILRKEKGKVKASSKKKIVKALKEHKELIIEVWKEHFGDDVE